MKTNIFNTIIGFCIMGGSILLVIVVLVGLGRLLMLTQIEAFEDRSVFMIGLLGALSICLIPFIFTIARKLGEGFRRGWNNEKEN